MATVELGASHAGWRDFYAGVPECSIFQSPQMAGYAKEIPGFEPVAVGLEGSTGLDGVVLALVQWERGLKGPFSARAIVVGGPVLSPGVGDRAAALRTLLGGLESALPWGVIYVEVRNMADRSADTTAFSRVGYRYEEHANFHVDLEPDPEAVLARIHPTKRRQIRKAVKSGIEVNPDPGPADLQALYGILEDLYRNRVRKPLPPVDFLTRFVGLAAAGDGSRIFCVRKDSRVIGGIVCPATRGEVLHEWYICGDRGAEADFPSLMATWAPMEWGCRHGFKVFDFMGAGRPGEAYGVRDFKRQFGGRPADYGRFRKVLRPAMMALGKTALAMWRRLPP